MAVKKSINLKLPFQSTYKGGVFDYNTDTSQALSDDLLCLLTTKKGSRVMRSSYHSPIFDYIGEPIDATTDHQLTNDVQNKVKIFLPQIDVLQVRMTESPDENLISIRILFTSKLIYNIKKTLIITLPTNGQITTT